MYYAGKVEYEVTLFLDSNANTISNVLQDKMGQSSSAFVNKMVLDLRTKKTKLKRPLPTSSSSVRKWRVY